MQIADDNQGRYYHKHDRYDIGSNRTTATGPSNGGSSTSDSSSNSGSGGGGKSTNAGAGGVIGGLVAVAVIVGFDVWYMNRRHERKR